MVALIVRPGSLNKQPMLFLRARLSVVRPDVQGMPTMIWINGTRDVAPANATQATSGITGNN